MPNQPEVDPSGDYARAQAWAMLQARYAEAGNYAVWATQVLQAMTDEIKLLNSSDTVGPNLENMLKLLSSVPALDFSKIAAYVPPTAPTYTAIPAYNAPTMGTLLAIPTVPDPELPPTPNPSIVFDNTQFTEELVTSLRSRLKADIEGVTAAEAAMFARHTGRVTAERAAAYTEITTQFSARGYDMPPGALLAKQTEMNNESSKRLTDASADIMMTAVKESLTGALQLVDTLGRLNDDNVMRDFESAKAKAQLEIDAFKTTIDGLLGVVQLSKTRVDAVVSANDGTVKAYLGQIEGQTAPMKAISESNQAQAQAYSAAVQGAGAAIDASSKPEELKLKAISVQGDIAGRAASLQIESSMREVTQQVETLRGLSQAAMQMIASAMNSVSSSVGFGFSGGATTSYKGNVDSQELDKILASQERIAALKQPPPSVAL
jgi:hypothetical protein